MKFSDLIADPLDPTRASHTKVWSNVAYFAATIVFAIQAFKGTLQPDVWLIYLGVVGAHGATSKVISLKYGKLAQKGGDAS